MTKYLIIFLLAVFTNIACNNKDIEGKESLSNSYYTCPMHPSVISNNPGSCPVCNMTLILVNKKDISTKTFNGNFITLDKQSLLLAGVKMDTVKYININNSDYITGITSQDPENIESISSSISGRIEKLYANSEGMIIEKGTRLYDLYSEKAIAMQKEFLEISKAKDFGKSNIFRIEELYENSKNRLLNIGIQPGQIDEIIRTRKVLKFITYYAENTGYLSELAVTENMYIDEGQLMFKINSSNDILVEAKLFENTNKKFLNKRNFNIVSESNSYNTFKGVLLFSEPLITSGSRYSLLRIRVKNNDQKLIQGMQVKVYAENKENKVIAIPNTAIINGKNKTVWKWAHDYTFKQIIILTGDEGSQNTEIISGLIPGDIIITKGSYLINSEFLLRK